MQIQNMIDRLSEACEEYGREINFVLLAPRLGSGGFKDF